MAYGPTQPAAERDEPLVDDVRSRVAATNAQVQRTHRRTSQAMAQVRYVDRLPHANPERVAAATHAKATEAARFTEVMEHEVAAHDQAVELHEQAARLQDEAGWPERAAAARGHATRARELSRRAGRSWPGSRRRPPLSRRRPRRRTSACPRGRCGFDRAWRRG
jgi:hypothetical protein